jgi:glycosyltransferase involved in cell wall biosynthesis
VFHESDDLGAGRSVLNAVPALETYGWTPSGWFPGDGPLLEAAATVLASVASAPKPIRYSVRGWRADPGALARIRGTPAYLRAFREAVLRLRPHVVHANTLRALPEARVARSLGLPVVVHVHELPDRGPKRAATLRWAARTATVLVAVSEAVAAMLKPYARRVPVLVARNGVPDRVARSAGASSATVGTVGTICRTKGTDVFLEAAALAHERCPDLRFEHIGQSGLDGDEELERRVTALAASPRVAGSVAMLGRRPASEGLARWETFVLASRQDAFPLATLEAMAAGLPVVATDVGGVKEQIEHLRTGVLVPPEDPGALADWIVRLHEDPGLRARLGAAAADSVRERFSIAAQARTLHTAYLAALNLRHGPPPVRDATVQSL